MIIDCHAHLVPPSLIEAVRTNAGSFPSLKLVPDGDASIAVIWDIEVESAAAADALLSTVLDRVSAMAGLEARAEAGIPVASAAGRRLCVTRPAPHRVRFLNTATQELLQKLSITAP